MDNAVGFVSRNLVTKTNFIKFRDGKIFHEFRGKKEPKWVGDTWYACMHAMQIGLVYKNGPMEKKKRKKEKRKSKE